MKEIYLHIGTPKTGTTTIQLYLSNQRKDLLDHGVCYPVSSTNPHNNRGGHHLLPIALKSGDDLEIARVWFPVVEEIKKNNSRKVIISSEEFSNLSSAAIRKVDHYLRNDRVTIVLYLRNYKDFMRSLYAEVIKNQPETRAFPDFIEDCKSKLNYNDLVARWAEVFGYENIIIRVYDKVVENADLLTDFCDVVGCPDDSPGQGDYMRRNRSISERNTNALRLMHRIGLLLSEKYYTDTFYPKYRTSFLANNPKYSLLRKLMDLVAAKNYSSEKTDTIISDITRDFDNRILKKYVAQSEIDYLDV